MGAGGRRGRQTFGKNTFKGTSTILNKTLNADFSGGLSRFEKMLTSPNGDALKDIHQNEEEAERYDGRPFKLGGVKSRTRCGEKPLCGYQNKIESILYEFGNICFQRSVNGPSRRPLVTLSKPRTTIYSAERSLRISIS